VKTIPIPRLIIYVILAGLILPIFVAISYFSQRAEMFQLQQAIEEIQYEATIKEKKQSLNIAVKEQFQNADHFYIDKQLETLNFLEQEAELLQKIAASSSFVNDERIKKRLEFLTKTESKSGNQLVFTEGVVQKSPLFHETVESMMHPVEVNVKNLQEILAKIEGIKMAGVELNSKPPQLLITDFRLERKSVGEDHEVFQLNLKLLKREFI